MAGIFSHNKCRWLLTYRKLSFIVPFVTIVNEVTHIACMKKHDLQSKHVFNIRATFEGFRARVI